jgi:hypothetical protein
MATLRAAVLGRGEIDMTDEDIRDLKRELRLHRWLLGIVLALKTVIFIMVFVGRRAARP